MQSLTALTSELEDHLQVEDTQFMIFIISLQAPTSLNHQKESIDNTEHREQISKIAERTPQHLEGNMTISSHNLMRVTHKMSDQHLHHEQQQQADMTSHWLHQLLTLGVDRNIIICLKFQVNRCTNICLLRFCHISGSNGKTQSWYWVALNRCSQSNKSIVSSVKLQQACVDKFHFISFCACTGKHLCLRHREAYIDNSGWGLLHPKHISFKYTTGD